MIANLEEDTVETGTWLTGDGEKAEASCEFKKTPELKRDKIVARDFVDIILKMIDC